MEVVSVITIVLATITVILTGVYVLLTLRIANKTAESVNITKDALVASQWESQKAIDAVNRQIAASERQAQEALFNQHKPVVVPTSKMSGVDWLEMMMQNKGLGVALNTWGIATVKSSEKFYRFGSTYFLVPDKLEKISLTDISNSLDFMFPGREFNGCSIYPMPDTAKLDTDVRLMVTYNDIFENRYIVVFDCSIQLNWRQVGNVKKIEQRLDEYLEEKRSQVFQNQQTTNEA